MEAKLIFPNVSFVQTSGQTVNVLVGQAFDMELLEVETGTTVILATTRDKVLQVDEQTTVTSRIKALSIGDSEVQVQDENRSVSFYLKVHVYTNEATGLNVPAPTEEPIT